MDFSAIPETPFVPLFNLVKKISIKISDLINGVYHMKEDQAENLSQIKNSIDKLDKKDSYYLKIISELKEKLVRKNQEIREFKKNQNYLAQQITDIENSMRESREFSDAQERSRSRDLRKINMFRSENKKIQKNLDETREQLKKANALLIDKQYNLYDLEKESEFNNDEIDDYSYDNHNDSYNDNYNDNDYNFVDNNEFNNLFYQNTLDDIDNDIIYNPEFFNLKNVNKDTFNSVMNCKVCQDAYLKGMHRYTIACIDKSDTCKKAYLNGESESTIQAISCSDFTENAYEEGLSPASIQAISSSKKSEKSYVSGESEYQIQANSKKIKYIEKRKEVSNLNKNDKIIKNIDFIVKPTLRRSRRLANKDKVVYK